VGRPRVREVGVEVYVSEVCSFLNIKRTLLLQTRNCGSRHLGVVATCRRTAASRLESNLRPHTVIAGSQESITASRRVTAKSSIDTKAGYISIRSQ